MESRRSHDKFYLKEDRKDTPKEYFKFLAGKANIVNLSDTKVLDIGCATGEFLYYLNSLNSALSYSGVDVMDSLLEKAKINCPNAALINGNIYTGENLPDEKYDVIFISGVMSIFDDFRPFIDNLLKLSKKVGKIYLFGFFNPEDVDLLIKVRPSTDDDTQPWEQGWNMPSIKTISNYIDRKGVSHTVTPWQIDIDLEKNANDPLRSYTINLEDHKKLVVSGLQLVYNFYLFEITNS